MGNSQTTCYEKLSNSVRKMYQSVLSQGDMKYLKSTLNLCLCNLLMILLNNNSKTFRLGVGGHFTKRSFWTAQSDCSSVFKR